MELSCSPKGGAGEAIPAGRKPWLLLAAITPASNNHIKNLTGCCTQVDRSINLATSCLRISGSNPVRFLLNGLKLEPSMASFTRKKNKWIIKRSGSVKRPQGPGHRALQSEGWGKKTALISYFIIYYLYKPSVNKSLGSSHFFTSTILLKKTCTISPSYHCKSIMGSICPLYHIKYYTVVNGCGAILASTKGKSL